MSKNDNKFYSLDRIRATGADYMMIIGPRSNGKTYAILKELITDYVKNNRQFAIFRRWSDDFKGSRGKQIFDALIQNNEIHKATNGVWTDVIYKSGQFFFGKYLDGDLVISDKPIGYALSLSAQEHFKSVSFEGVYNVFFDEFITRSEFGYLSSEFVIFMNLLSTVIRQKDNAKIYMAGNTVNQYCIYFNEMGLTNIKKMKPGDIDVYTYGETGLKVAVEYTIPFSGKVTSNKFFAFDNPRLKMITGSDKGSWEIDIYPHLPFKYKPKDILLTYFIIFDGCTMQMEVIQQGENIITYCHRKTTELKKPDEDLIFSPDADARYNWNPNILKIHNPKIKAIMSKVFDKNKIFYQDNELGEYIRNYLIWCVKN